MKKKSETVNYGDYLHGSGSFDDESEMPVIVDPDTGEGWISPMLTGVRTRRNLGMDSDYPSHRRAAEAFGKYISEWASNSIVDDKEALRKYVKRYADAMEKYKAEHGRYPRQRIMGHSRGGAAAVELMRAINREHPELPQVDEFVGLDPYDYPGAKTEPPTRSDRRLLARKSIIARPENRSVLAEGGENTIENIMGGLSNMLVQPATPVNPLSKVRSLSVSVPNANHNAMDVLMEAAMEARRARDRKELRKIMKGYNRLSRIESRESPDYDDRDRRQQYEKVAEDNAGQSTTLGVPAPLVAGGLTASAILALQALGYPGNKSNLDAMMDITDATEPERAAVHERNRRNYVRSAILAALAVGGVSGLGKAIMK